MDVPDPEIGQGHGFVEAGPSVQPPCPASPFRAQFSLAVSLLSGLILLSALAAILWLSASLPKLDRVEDPDRALELMVGRVMEAQDGLERSPAWQQRLVEWMTGSRAAEREQVLGWYRELAGSNGTALSKVRLAILEGESGRPQAALAMADSWRTMGDPLSSYAPMIEAAYGTAPLERATEVALQASLAELLPAGWFYSHLAARLARRAGDDPLLSSVVQSIEARAAMRQALSQLLMAAQVGCLILGSVALARIVRLKGRRKQLSKLHEPGVPPPWPGGVGTAILLRGGALGAVLTLAFLILAPAEHVSLRAVAIPLTNLPLLALAYVYLLKPAGLTFRDGFGLVIDRAHAGRLAGSVLAVVAAGIWGDWVMGRVAESLNLANHWTEWFDSDLVWASRPVLAVSLLEYVVFAPVFEEIAFRGLLYAILRRRLRVWPAAAISAGIFAAAHGYGLIGFVSVFWSGLLWAWIYERTGSLLPGMIAHATNNLLVCLSVMALLRG